MSSEIEHAAIALRAVYAALNRPRYVRSAGEAIRAEFDDG